MKTSKMLFVIATLIAFPSVSLAQQQDVETNAQGYVGSLSSNSLVGLSYSGNFTAKAKSGDASQSGGAVGVDLKFDEVTNNTLKGTFVNYSRLKTGCSGKYKFYQVPPDKGVLLQLQILIDDQQCRGVLKFTTVSDRELSGFLVRNDGERKIELTH